VYTCWPVHGMTELVDWWRNLESLLENSLLTLDTDVPWPLHEPTQITGGLNVLSNPEVSWSLFEERILPFLLFRFLYDKGRRGRHFFPHDLLLSLQIKHELVSIYDWNVSLGNCINPARYTASQAGPVFS